MPKIQSVEQTIAARGAIDGGQRANPGDEALTVIGNSAEDVNKFLQAKADQDEKLRQANFLIDSQIKWEDKLTKMKNDFPQGSGYTEKVVDEFNKFSADSLNNVSPRYRKDFEGNLLNFKGNLVSSAIHSEASLKTAYQKNLFQDQVNLISNRARATGQVDDNLYSAVEKKIDLYDVDPEVKDGFRKMLKNDVGSSYIQGLIEKDPAKALEELKTDRYQELDNKIYDSLSNRAESTLKANAVKLEKIKFTDPVAYDLHKNPALAGDSAALVTAQQERGVPDADISVMTNSMATGAVAQITGAQTADDFLAVKVSLKDKFGDYYDVAVKDLYKNKLPMDYQLLFAMDESKDVDQVQAMMKVVQGGGSLSSDKNSVISLATDKATANGKDFKRDVKLPVLKNMSRTMQFLGTEGMPDKYRDNLNNSVIAMAASFYNSGSSAGDAVEKATKWITDSYAVKSLNGSEYRIPISTEYDADVVHKNLMSNLAHLDIKFPTTDDRSKNYLETLKRTASFVTNPNQDGVYLVANDGSYIVDKYSSETQKGLFLPAAGAKRVEFKFDEAFMDKQLAPSEVKKIREQGKRLNLSEGQITQNLQTERVAKTYKNLSSKMER